MKQYPREFIRKLEHGDKVSQKQLFEQLYASMFRVCQRYIVKTDEAEDCVMKGFMNAFQHIGQLNYQGEESLFKWLRKIMVNECLTELRKKHNFYMIPEEQLPEVLIEADVWNKIEVEDLNNLVLRLPTGYRTVFSLFVVEGYAHKEIATMLGITESTSKSQLLKAKSKLKIMITQNQLAYGTIGK
ncbi:MAG: sigma-70 family RNA polymerase sigma factor [Bacteroidota bacterium]